MLNKHEISGLPIWKPTKRVFNILDDSMDKKLKLKAFSNSSRGFITKKEIREYIFTKHNNSCVYCGSNEFMQIDHIKSVRRCFDEKDFNYCNSIENLQALCRKCNASKLP